MESPTKTLCRTYQSTEDEVVDHKSDVSIVPKSEGTLHKSDGSAVPKSEGTLRGLSKAPMGQAKRRRLPRDGHSFVELSKGTPEWMKFTDLKESHPVEVVKSARDRGLIDEPAFA